MKQLTIQVTGAAGNTGRAVADEGLVRAAGKADDMPSRNLVRRG